VNSIDECELTNRIECELHHHGGTLPLATNAAWRGYLAACLEWGLISPSVYSRLFDKLPPIDQDPSVGILLGYDDDSDAKE